MSLNEVIEAIYQNGTVKADPGIFKAGNGNGVGDYPVLVLAVGSKLYNLKKDTSTGQWSLHSVT